MACCKVKVDEYSLHGFSRIWITAFMIILMLKWWQRRSKTSKMLWTTWHGLTCTAEWHRIQTTTTCKVKRMSRSTNELGGAFLAQLRVSVWPGFDSGQMPYAGWVCCWFSPCYDAFLRVRRFSPFTKANISKFWFDQDRRPAWKPANADAASALIIVNYTLPTYYLQGGGGEGLTVFVLWLMNNC